MSRYEDLDEQKQFACRVIADHARATAFSIADGILPGNEGRNYVLRKIMRRAIYQGHYTLGMESGFFDEVTDFVVGQMKEAYPELERHREYIKKMVRLEEERFGATLITGLMKLDDLLEKYEMPVHMGGPADVQPGWVPAFELAKLYDTFGTPIDLMYVILHEDRRGRSEYCREQRWEVSTFKGRSEISKITGDEFKELIEIELKLLQQQSEKSKNESSLGTKPAYVALSRRANTKSQFEGYESTRVDNARIVALIKGGEVQALVEGDEGEVVLDQTPFYAESGGQVGDVGALVSTAGGTDFLATVVDTYSPTQGLIVHKVKVEKGTLKVGDSITAEVDVAKRDATRRNHTATHLMHAALREVLGTHVKQAGSVVAPSYLRFDFTHYQPLTAAEIDEIERLVNYHILRNTPVQRNEMDMEAAMRTGAMALFGEKYGEKVWVLSIPGAEGVFSKELCGGTHVRATGDIGLFKITSDESIASGTRRIRAVTGADAFARFQEDEKLIDKLAGDLRTTRADLPGLVERLQSELKKARRDADELRLKIATGAGSGSANGDEPREISGVRVVAREASGLDAAGMRQLSDTLLARLKSGVVVIGRSSDGKASLIVRISDDLLKKVPAGQVIKELAPIIGGRGGGKPDMAEGGGSQPEKLSEALEASYGVIEKLLGQAT